MARFRDLPIKRKMSVAVLGTTTLTLLIACVAFIAYERIAFRQTMARNLNVLSDALARNCTGALSFDNKDDAEATLQALGAEPSVLAACLYTEKGAQFADYAKPGVAKDLPKKPKEDGARFGRDFLIWCARWCSMKAGLGRSTCAPTWRTSTPGFVNMPRSAAS